jgi:hypothetical protein
LVQWFAFRKFNNFRIFRELSNETVSVLFAPASKASELFVEWTAPFVTVEMKIESDGNISQTVNITLISTILLYAFDRAKEQKAKVIPVIYRTKLLNLNAHLTNPCLLQCCQL